MKKHAIRDFNCSEECIDDCLNRDYATFFQVPVCLAQNEFCRCSQNIFWLMKYEPKIDHYSRNQSVTVKELLMSIERYWGIWDFYYAYVISIINESSITICQDHNEIINHLIGGATLGPEGAGYRGIRLGSSGSRIEPPHILLVSKTLKPPLWWIHLQDQSSGLRERPPRLKCQLTIVNQQRNQD